MTTRRSLREALSAELRFAGPAFGLLFLAGWLITFPIAYRHALRRLPKETP
jgi:hypothetical protein